MSVEFSRASGSCGDREMTIFWASLRGVNLGSSGSGMNLSVIR
jgi:hypothetical protein